MLEASEALFSIISSIEPSSSQSDLQPDVHHAWRIAQ
jgi:hypothetical protein